MTVRPAVKMPRVLFTAFLCLALVLGKAPAANIPAADQAWQTVLEQAAGPGNRFRSKEEALDAARQHLDRQEKVLRDFGRLYPGDSRHYSAEIRLAAVLAAKARLRHEPNQMDLARRILEDLENRADTPLPVKADAGFARISQQMQDVNGHADESSRAALLQSVRQFDATYPGDRRTGNLLTEISTLYDNQPVQKKALLEEASPRVTDAEVRQRVADDLRRVALLGTPVSLRLQPWGGGPVLDLGSRRGRVQVVVFWASFSLPSLHELAALQQVAAQFTAEPVDFSTVSLDEDKAALAGMIKTADLRWPTHYDGKGWTGGLVRSVGLNALPTVFVLDRQGRLFSLNARGDEAATIRRALAAQP